MGLNLTNIAKDVVSAANTVVSTAKGDTKDQLSSWSSVYNSEKGAASAAQATGQSPSVTQTGIPQPGTDPTEVANWWAGLSHDDQEALQATNYDTLGQLQGLPATVLNDANRSRLDDHMAALNSQLNSCPADGPPLSDAGRAALQDQLAQDQGIKDALQQTDPPVFLLRYDPVGTAGPPFADAWNAATLGAPQFGTYVGPMTSRSQTGAEIAIGNPDEADNTAVFVPGTTNNVRNLKGLTTGDAARLYKEMSDETGPKAVVIWLDGAEPQNIAPDATLDYWAEADTSNLVADLNGLRAAHVSASASGDGGHLTAIGHSYGSYMVGRALTHGASVDDVIFVGSPGVGVNHASDLGMDPQHVWDGQSGTDQILIAGKRFTPDPLTGNNPADADFGAQHFSVSGTHSHGDYLKPGESLDNIALIASGKYDDVHRTSAPNYRGAYELPGDAIALALNPVDALGGMVKDWVTGHPIEAGERYVEGLITQGKTYINLFEDEVNINGDIINWVADKAVDGVNGARDWVDGEVNQFETGVANWVGGMFRW